MQKMMKQHPNMLDTARNENNRKKANLEPKVNDIQLSYHFR
jgi:hypothetical protein